MYNLTIFQKSYFLTNFKVSEKWLYVLGALKKVCQGFGGVRKQFRVSKNDIFRKFLKIVLHMYSMSGFCRWQPDSTDPLI